MQPIAFIVANDGLYVNRIDLIDALTELQPAYPKLLNLNPVIQLFTKFGEPPPDAEIGTHCQLVIPSVKIKLDAILTDRGVCFNVFDLLKFFLCHDPVDDSMRSMALMLIDIISSHFPIIFSLIREKDNDY
jgi:hypothetical protein